MSPAVVSEHCLRDYRFAMNLERHPGKTWQWNVQVLSLLACLLGSASVFADDWPQWLGPKRDGVWRETGILDAFPTGGPRFRWRTKIGAGYSGPAVVGDKVFVTDRVLGEGSRNPANPFNLSVVGGSERVLCLDASTGKILWKHEYPCRYRVSYAAGPRTTPTISDGRVYTLGAMGDLLCLDAESGKVDWSKNLPKEYAAKVPMWGYAAHALVDGDKLICLAGGPGSIVIALEKSTGKELWRRFPRTKSATVRQSSSRQAGVANSSSGIPRPSMASTPRRDVSRGPRNSQSTQE